MDLAGQKFGRLTAQWPAGRSGKRGNAIHWLCLCECGNFKVTRTSSLRRGLTKSCGCLQKERAREFVLKNKPCLKHGMAGTPEYFAYMNAKKRCECPTNSAWMDYGGRGIRFLFESLEEFYADLGPKPTPAHSVDRIDNDGNYEPGNVRWSLPDVQRRNQRPPRKRKTLATVETPQEGLAYGRPKGESENRSDSRFERNSA